MKKEYHDHEEHRDAQAVRAEILDAACGMTPEQRAMLIALLEAIVGK